jgi:ribosomal protein S18 acetylase RimI-like enzyme
MGLIPSQHAEHIRQLLERDRNWCAYALADLDPGFVEDTVWYLGNNSLIMTYAGINPPVLFCTGDPVRISRLLSDIPAGSYQYSVPADHLDVLPGRMELQTTVSMLRMVLDRSRFPMDRDWGAKRLSSRQLPDIHALFANHSDQPDAFVPSQLDQDTFFGIFEKNRMVSFAGTHVLSSASSVAAVGNVFTHPDHRGNGLATRVTGAVTASLLQQGIRTIVLNVSGKNNPAVQAYKKLGFTTVCSYYEGAGTIS